MFYLNDVGSNFELPRTPSLYGEKKEIKENGIHYSD